MIICVIVIFFIILGIIVKHYMHKKNNKINICHNYNGNIFEIIGYKNDYIISKNNRYDFKVKNGKIIASRDRNATNEFIYYDT